MNLWNGAGVTRSETGSAGESELGRVLDAYLASLESGVPADPDELAAAHPEIADRLLACISVLNLTSQVAGAEIIDAAAAAAGARLGDFILIGPIGRGGMGIVFEARQISLKRKVALKALPFASALDPRQLSRFQIEARAAAQLHHTNIVPIFSVGFERGVHFYAMQLIEGRTLAALIRELRDDAESTGPRSNPPLPRGAARHRLVAELGVQAADALEHAHRQGIVHRDVKPSNLMVDVRNNLWITDFGLARMDADGGLTALGDVLGTLRYMSPEQSSGDPSRVDHRTDVYSLGATLYELATLQPLHTGRNRDELLQRRAEGEPRRLRSWDRSIPRDLETIILRALNRDPARRYATARDLADDLRRFLDHRPILARRPSLWKRAERWTRRHKALSSALAFALLLTIVGGAVIGSLIARNRDLGRVQRHAEYVRDVGRAGQYVERNKLAEAVEILARHIPAPGADDDRSFPWHYLWRLCHVQPQQLKGHVGDVYHVEYSPDGKTLATAGQDGTARTWDAATGALLRTLRGHQGDVDCATFSPDGKTLATCGDDGTVRLWNALDESEPSIVLGRHDKEAVSVVFSLDGRTLFSGDDEGRVNMWDVTTAREARSSVLVPKARINSLALSPDGRSLAVAAGPVRLIEAHTLERKADPPGFQAVFCVAFSHDGRIVAGAEEEGRVRLSIEKNGVRAGRLLTLAGSGRVEGLTFSPDDRVLAACHSEGIVCLWDVESGARLRSYRSGHNRIWGASFSPDGRKLAVCGIDGAVEIWDERYAQDGQTAPLSRPIDSRVTPVFTPGAFIAAYSKDRKTFYLDPLDLATRTIRSGAICDLPGVQLGVFSPDGSRLAVHQILPPWTQTVFAQANSAPPPLEEVPDYHSGTEASQAPRSLAFSSDGTKLAASIGYRGVFVWDVPSGRLLASSRDDYNSLAFSPRGDRLAMASLHSLRVWDLTTGSIRDYSDSGLGFPGTIAFTPDGRKLVVGFGTSRSVAVWDLDDFEGKPGILELHDGPSALAVSTNGKIAAFGSDEGMVNLVDLSTLRTILTLDARSRDVRVLQFSPDGSTLLAVMYSDSKTPPVVTAWTLSPSAEAWLGLADFSGR